MAVQHRQEWHVWALTAGIVLAVFAGNWEELGLGFPFLPDRLLLFAGIAGAILTVVWLHEREAPRFTAPHFFLLLTCVWAFGSAIFIGATGRDSMFELLDRLGIVPFAMFGVAAIAFRTERERRILLAGLVVLGAYLGLTALFEAFKLNALVFPKYILDPEVGGQAGRARGPFASSVAMGLGLYACAVAAAIAFVTWKRPAARAAAAATALLCAAGLVFAVTRSIWLASTVATLGTFVAFGELRRYVVPAVVAGLTIVIGSLALVPGLQAQASDRAEARIPIWDRRNTNTAAINMIETKPLLGYGWDQFDAQGRNHFEVAADYPQTGGDNTVHNVFLAHAAELGLIGATLWAIAFALGIGGTIIRRGPPELRPWRIGLLALALHWLVVANFVPLPYVFANLLLWTWAGVVAGGMLAARAEPRAAAA